MAEFHHNRWFSATTRRLSKAARYTEAVHSVNLLAS
jgi:hypothetical protein